LRAVTTARTRVVLVWIVAALGTGCASKDEPAPSGVGGVGLTGGVPAAGGAGASAAGLGGGGAGVPSLAGTGGAAGQGAGGLVNVGGAGVAGAGTAGSTGGTPASGGLGGLGSSGGESQAGSPAAGGAGSGSAGAPPLGPSKIVLVAGTGTGGDGSPAVSAAVLNPYGAVVDPVTGDVYIAEVDTGKIRHIDASGVITTVVGPGAPGDAADVVLNQPHDLLFQPGTRRLFIADTMNGNVYRYDAESGTVAMFVGPDAPFPGVSRVYCLAFSPNGTDLYFTGPDDVRVIDLDAMAQKPAVSYPAARVIAIDSKGTLYAVKNRPNGDALQVVSASGAITDMPATVNVVSDPKHLAIDSNDKVLVADTELQLLRRYDAQDDTLETLVGNGMAGLGTLDGDPKNAQLKRPHGVFEDPKTGVIYISDSENNRVLKITR
jgi:hypothetical protein